MIQIDACLPDDPVALPLLDRLSETLAAITGDSGRSSFDPHDLMLPKSLFVIARAADGVAVGCGAYRPLGDGVAGVKRMFALPGTSGVGSAVLAYLERCAQDDGYREIWLETRRVNERAVRFYRRHGYREIENYGRYVGRPEAICLAKPLTGQRRHPPG
jgi:GNAT superfamily N-acetyltransferase